MADFELPIGAKCKTALAMGFWHPITSYDTSSKLTRDVGEQETHPK